VWGGAQDSSTDERSPTAAGRRLFLAAVLVAIAAAAASAADRRAIDLPIHFEANDGQAQAGVRYLARGEGMTVFVLSREIVFLAGERDEPMTPDERGRARAPLRPRVVRMRFRGATDGVEPHGVDPLPASTHYLVGNDPAAWRRDVPSFARIQLDNLYPGVSLSLHGSRGHVRFDLTLSPGADPAQIDIEFEGADGIDIDGDGALALKGGKGEFRQSPPILWQDGPAGRRPVSGRFVSRGPHRVGFQVDDWDRASTLTIDPVLSWESEIGGSLSEYATGIGLDGAGNVYITGQTFSSNFPAVAPSPTTSPLGTNAFVAKYDPNGALVWAAVIGGSSVDFPMAGAVDAAGHAVVVGYTASSDFPVVNGYPNVVRRVLSTLAFVSKLDTNGSTLLYSTYFGGSRSVYPLDPDLFFVNAGGVAVDGAGGIYLTGFTDTLDFPTTEGAFQPFRAVAPTKYDGSAYATKLDSTRAGTDSLVWSTYLGGSSDEKGNAIALGPGGVVAVTGATSSFDFRWQGPAPYRAFRNGGTDAFVASLSADGASMRYFSFLGGSQNEGGAGIGFDAAGHIVVVGATSSRDFPTKNAALPSDPDGSSALDGFVASFDPSHGGDGSLVYSTYLGGNGRDTVSAVAVDAHGYAYATGTTNSTNFPGATAPLLGPIGFGSFVTFSSPV